MSGKIMPNGDYVGTRPGYVEPSAEDKALFEKMMKKFALAADKKVKKKAAEKKQ